MRAAFPTFKTLSWTLKAAFGDQADDVAWLINQRALELNAYEKPPEFLNENFSDAKLKPELDAVNKVWDDPAKTISGYPDARFWEIRWLHAKGFQMEPVLDATGTTIGYRFLPPGGAAAFVSWHARTDKTGPVTRIPSIFYELPLGAGCGPGWI